MEKKNGQQVKGEDEVFIIVEENKDKIHPEKDDQKQEETTDQPEDSQLEENEELIKVEQTDDNTEQKHGNSEQKDTIFKEKKKCSFFGTLEKPLRRKLLCFLLCCLIFVILYTVAFTLGMLFGLPRRPMEITEGAVVSDHETCSKIGRNTLAEGGSAVDASISTLLCLGLMSPHSMGIGGGNFMVVYNAENKEVTAIDARETAPSLVNQRMFQAMQSQQSPLFIGVPGEIMGYWEAHKLHGRLPWRKLFQPSIDLAENGHHLSGPTAEAMQVLQTWTKINFTKITGFCDIFCDQHGKPLKEGAFIRRPKLAKTLRGIADKGIDFFYKGPIPAQMAKEIQAEGGIMKKKDIENYRVRVDRGISVNLGKVTLLTLGAPSGGPVLGLILNILEGLNLTPESMATLARRASTYHAIVEAFKLSYAERANLADPYFVEGVNQTVEKMTTESFAAKLRQRLDRQRTHNVSYYTDTVARGEEFGTAHVSVLAPDGDAVSVTSTINFYFGAMMVSPSTGIIWNNELSDFSLPRQGDPKVSHLNTAAYGKRPLSSMAPAIFVDKKGVVQLIVGAAGGSKITTTVAQVSADMLWFGDDVSSAVRRKRVHHQLEPNVLVYEQGFQQDIIEELEKKGHDVKIHNRYLAVVEAIARNAETGEITAFADERKISGQAQYLRKKYDVRFY